MKHIDVIGHVQGKSIFIDDIPEVEGTLHALPFFSELAHGKILSIDIDQALTAKGVQAIYLARDIPGVNQIGGILPDEPLFAEDRVHFMGQPLGVIVAETRLQAREARALLDIRMEALEVNIDPRKAKEAGALLFPPRTFSSGNIEDAFMSADFVFEGRADSGGQEHLYIETQGAYAIPGEKNRIRVYSSTQGPTIVQKTISGVLGIPMHDIEVDVTRLGGAFGGKEDQATPWGVMAALAAKLSGKPVKLILDREDDIKVTGKRHPYSSDFRIGIDSEFNIVAYEVVYYQNGGAAADLSPAILERTLFHATNAYYIPNVRATAYSCRTNLPPFTAFRGFGGPQAMFVIESAIALAARKLKVDTSIIQERNLARKGHVFPYGQPCVSNHAKESWRLLHTLHPIGSIRDSVYAYNQKHVFRKKGLAFMPVCFGISFTNTQMNQGRALIHVYQDGSVGVSTGAIEMGQGVNTKITQVVAGAFGIRPERVHIESTNTSRVANTSPTAASSGADLNGKAAMNACTAIIDRLKGKAADILTCQPDRISIRDEWIYKDSESSDLTWEKLVREALADRIKLSEVGHYATPDIYFDKTKEKGHPFAYHVFGVALTVVELDCLLGTYEIESVRIVHDYGNSLNPGIDQGQVEGALLQGIGWMTVEELKYDESGRLLSDSLSKYKVPDIFMTPKHIQINSLPGDGPEMALLRSKAVGEPPFMYGIGSYFALQQALLAYNPDYIPIFDAPLTPEKVLMGLYREGENR